MAGVPGQRSVQQPMRAAAAVQRILGRAATQGAGGPVSPRGVAMFGGHYFTVDLSGGVSRLTPRGPVPFTPVPAAPDPAPAPDVPVVPAVPDVAVVVDVAVVPAKPKRKRAAGKRRRADET